MPDGAIYFNFLNYQLDNILLAKVGYQILKYNNVYDLSLSIEEKEISQKTSILNLKYTVDKLAEKLKSKIFYCGYEPAIDEETRMFSSFEMGPLKGWSNCGLA